MRQTRTALQHLRRGAERGPDPHTLTYSDPSDGTYAQLIHGTSSLREDVAPAFPSLPRSCPWRTRAGGAWWRAASCASARTVVAWTPTATGRWTGASRRRTTTPTRSSRAQRHSGARDGSAAGGWCLVPACSCGGYGVGKDYNLKEESLGAAPFRWACISACDAGSRRGLLGRMVWPT